jgi:predicted regulator of Ras-like GTPase activity (Roadblock/LC7/MglB family)
LNGIGLEFDFVEGLKWEILMARAGDEDIVATLEKIRTLDIGDNYIKATERANKFAKEHPNIFFQEQ